MTQIPYGEQYPPPPYNPVQGQISAPPAPAAPPPPSGTNGFAIASLIFGIVALTQIKKRNQGGKGMAIAGLALSGAWLAAICVGVVVAIIANNDDVKANTDPTTRPSKEVLVRVETLKTGDCVNDLQETDSLRKLPAINCSQPHQGKVVGEFNVTGSSFPVTRRSPSRRRTDVSISSTPTLRRPTVPRMLISASIRGERNAAGKPACAARWTTT